MFLTLKELLDTVLSLNSKDHLKLIWVEVYLFPFSGILWNQAVSLHIYIVKIVMSGCYTSFSLIKKIYINQILESISLIMRPFVKTETAERRQGFTVNSTAEACFYPTVQKQSTAFVILQMTFDYFSLQPETISMTLPSYSFTMSSS